MTLVGHRCDHVRPSPLSNEFYCLFSDDLGEFGAVDVMLDRLDSDGHLVALLRLGFL